MDFLVKRKINTINKFLTKHKNFQVQSQTTQLEQNNYISSFISLIRTNPQARPVQIK